MGENTINDAMLARLLRLVSGVQNVFLGQPVVADPNLIVTVVDWADGALTVAAQPDVPRNLTCTLTDADASITAGLLTFKGLDPQGRPVEDVMDMTAGLAWVGTKIFAQVDSAVISGTAGIPAPGVDTLVAGIGDVIGLPNDINDAEEVLHSFLGAAEVTPDAIATGEGTSGINVTSATYDGSKIMYAAVQSAAQA